MNTRRLVLGELDTNAWLVDDKAGGPLIVIDPAGDTEELLAAIDGRPVAAVVLTHGHFDHLGAAEAVVHMTGAPLMVHKADADAITTAEGTGAAMFGYKHAAPEADRRLADGDVVEAGGVALRVIHTPGHTPGSISLYAPEEGELFSGDTLFAGSIGRTDFPGGDSAAILRSLARLATLPDETRVHPGHGPDTTIAREAMINPFWPRA
jgi:glyoxylase-like metal-dependent hydrolase (beta-lactamase superfamily II)